MSCIVTDSRPESLTLIAAQHEDWIIQQAITLLEHRIFKAGACLSSPAAVRDYLRLKLVAEPNEVFAVVFMDSQHRAGLRAAVQGLGRPDLGVSAGGRPACLGPQRLGIDPGAPASIGSDRALGRRSRAHGTAESRPGHDGRCPGGGSLHRRRGRTVLLCRSRSPVAAVCIPPLHAVSFNPAWSQRELRLPPLVAVPKAAWLQCAFFVAAEAALAFDWGFDPFPGRPAMMAPHSIVSFAVARHRHGPRVVGRRVVRIQHCGCGRRRCS